LTNRHHRESSWSSISSCFSSGEPIWNAAIRWIDCCRKALANALAQKIKRWSARHRHQSRGPTETEREPFFLQFLAPVLEGAADGEPLAVSGDLLWIVPHDLRHYVPFHAVAFEGKLLIDRKPICYAPSSSVMKLCLERHTGRLDRALVVGDTRGHVEESTKVVGTVTILLLEPDPPRGGATVWNDGPQSIYLGLSHADNSTASRVLAPKSGFRIDWASETAFRCDGLWAVAKTTGQRVHVLNEEMLVQARAEARRIAELFRVEPLLDKTATKTRVAACAQTSSVVTRASFVDDRFLRESGSVGCAAIRRPHPQRWTGKSMQKWVSKCYRSGSDASLKRRAMTSSTSPAMRNSTSEASLVPSTTVACRVTFDAGLLIPRGCNL
jgi:hypothetical protein